ncbi:MAG: IS6 family transposase ISPko6 [Legionellaceae bacterium]
MINFKWRHFQKDIILTLVRWYLAYPLSYRDIEEMMRERGICVDHSTINRWVMYYAPLLEAQFRHKHKKKVSTSWYMDETYIKIKGVWHYLYRAVDKEGYTVDFMLSEKRDEPAARTFFEKAIGSSGYPLKVTIDKSGSNEASLESINCQLFILLLIGCVFFQIEIRQIKYLNNIVEQDYRGIKRIVKPMMGFKAVHSAASTLVGIELHRMLRKGQHQQAANMTLFEQFYSLAA